MPRISNIEMLQKMVQPTLFIRTIAKVQDLPVLIGQSYGKMAAYLQEVGELLADVPYVAYHNMDMQNLDVEIGFPVARQRRYPIRLHPCRESGLLHVPRRLQRDGAGL